MRPSAAAAEPESRSSRDTPAWCALSGRAAPACTGSLASARTSAAAAHCSGGDEQLADLANRAVAAAALGDVVRDGLDRLGGVGHRARQPDALQRRQIVQVVADERHLVAARVRARAQLVDGHALVGDAQNTSSIFSLAARAWTMALSSPEMMRDRHARLAHSSQTHAVAGVEFFQHLAVWAVVHARVGQYAVDVDAQQAHATRAIRHLHAARAGRRATQSATAGACRPATSTAATRPISCAR